jgi:hypothetical protein
MPDTSLENKDWSNDMMWLKRLFGGDTGGYPHPRFGARGKDTSQPRDYSQPFAARQNATWLGILMSCLLLYLVLPVQGQESEPVTVIDAFGEEITITNVRS